MLAKTLQVKSQELFEEWMSKLRHHRVFRQNEIATYPHERHQFYHNSSPSLNESMKKVGYDEAQPECREWNKKYRSTGEVDICSHTPSPEVYSYQADVHPPGQGQFLAPFFRRHGQVLQRLFLTKVNLLSLNKWSNQSLCFLLDLEECESYLLELNLLLKSMEVLHRTYSAPVISGLQVSICANNNNHLTVVF